jgi:hypothetical protein
MPKDDELSKRREDAATLSEIVNMIAGFTEDEIKEFNRLVLQLCP